jgi:hypothetical protein
MEKPISFIGLLKAIWLIVLFKASFGVLWALFNWGYNNVVSTLLVSNVVLVNNASHTRKYLYRKERSVILKPRNKNWLTSEISSQYGKLYHVTSGVLRMSFIKRTDELFKFVIVKCNEAMNRLNRLHSHNRIQTNW